MSEPKGVFGISELDELTDEERKTVLKARETCTCGAAWRFGLDVDTRRIIPATHRPECIYAQQLAREPAPAPPPPPPPPPVEPSPEERFIGVLERIEAILERIAAQLEKAKDTPAPAPAPVETPAEPVP